MKQAVDNCLPIIKLINEGVEKKANAELKPYDITFSQMRMLYYVYNSGKDFVALKELEKAFGVSQQTVAGITYRLAQKDLIEIIVDTKDRRAKNVTLTSEGEKLAEIASTKILEIEKLLTQNLDETEKQEFFRLIKKVYQNVK